MGRAGGTFHLLRRVMHLTLIAGVSYRLTRRPSVSDVPRDAFQSVPLLKDATPQTIALDPRAFRGQGSRRLRASAAWQFIVLSEGVVALSGFSSGSPSYRCCSAGRDRPARPRAPIRTARPGRRTRYASPVPECRRSGNRSWRARLRTGAPQASVSHARAKRSGISSSERPAKASASATCADLERVHAEDPVLLQRRIGPALRLTQTSTVGGLSETEVTAEAVSPHSPAGPRCRHHMNRRHQPAHRLAVGGRVDSAHRRFDPRHRRIGSFFGIKGSTGSFVGGQARTRPANRILCVWNAPAGAPWGPLSVARRCCCFVACRIAKPKDQ